MEKRWLVVTPADALIAEVSSRIGDLFDRIWHEIRPVSIDQGLWDVWFESDEGVSICVSIAEHSQHVRVLCEEFEFAEIDRSEAAAFVAAVLGGDVAFRRSGVLRASLTAIVGGAWTASAPVRPTGLSAWEQNHMIG